MAAQGAVFHTGPPPARAIDSQKAMRAILDKTAVGEIIGVSQALVTREQLENTQDPAVCEITRADSFKASNSGVANYYGTLYDPQMGATERGGRCARCQVSNGHCQGHYGKIMFQRMVCGKLQPNPVYHPYYVKMTADIANSVCYNCGNVILRDVVKSKKLMHANQTQRLKLIAEATLKQPCPHCRAGVNYQYKVAKNSPFTITRQNPNTTESAVSVVFPMDLYKIFMAISPSDAKILGFSQEFAWSNHPRDLLLFGILVLPTCKRPVAWRDNSPDDNDLTKRYRSIVEAANKLRAHVPTGHTAEKVELSYFNVALDLMMYYNDLLVGGSSSASASEGGLQAIRDLLNGKGAFRRLVGSKTTDYSARTVAGPAPELDIDEIGVPQEFASKLTWPERVFRTLYKNTDTGEEKIVTNLEYLQKKVRDGLVKAYDHGGDRIRITTTNRDVIELQPGDIVYRYLQNGDLIYVNRNPSLHAWSWQAVTVVLMPIRTVLVNGALAPGLGLDNDGDEVNLHFPQTEEARAEMQELSAPKRCLLNTAHGGIQVAAVIDSLVGGTLLTRPYVEMDRSEWLEGFSVMRRREYDSQAFFARAKAAGYNALSGRGLFSVLLPDDLTYRAPIKADKRFKWQWKDANNVKQEKVENVFVIENGLLKSGTITFDHVGKGASFATFLEMHYGPKYYVAFLSDYMRLCSWYLMNQAITVSLADCVALEENPPDEAKLREVVAAATTEASRYMIPLRNKAEDERRMENMINALNQVRSESMSVLEYRFSQTNLWWLAYSGAKGSLANYVQMMGAVGLAVIQDQLLPRGVGRGDTARVTPFFPVGSQNPKAIGFCDRNFGVGLDPIGYWAYSMETRSSTVQGKNIGLAGYATRRMVEAMQDLAVQHDGTTRRQGRIIQFVSNDIGIASEYLIKLRDNFGQFYSYLDAVNILNIINGLYPDAPRRTIDTTLYRDLTGFIDDHTFTVAQTVNTAVKAAHHAILGRQLLGLEIVVPDDSEAPLPRDASENANERNAPYSRAQHVINRFRRYLHDGFRQALIQPGTAIGVIVGTGLGEVLTQRGLKQKTVVGTGAAARQSNQMNALTAMINAPAEATNRNAFIYFDPPVKFRDLYKQMKYFETLTINRLYKPGGIEIYRQQSVDTSWYELYEQLYHPGGTQLRPDAQAVLIRITFDTQVLYNYDIALSAIGEVLKPISKIMYISPPHLGVIDIYNTTPQTEYDQIYTFLRNSMIPAILSTSFSGIKEIETCLPSYIPLLATIQYEKELVKGTKWVISPDIKIIRMAPVKLYMLEPLLTELGFTSNLTDPEYPGSLVVTATNAVTPKNRSRGPRAALYQRATRPESFDKYNVAYFETVGTNLAKIVLVPGVDLRYTYSNHSAEVEQVFGVTAAEGMFTVEFGKILTAVVPTHLELVSNYMHSPGRPTPLKLTGMSAQGIGPWSQAAFEQAQKNLMEAAPSNVSEKDTTHVSIFTGKMVPLGSGTVRIVTPSGHAADLEANLRRIARGEIPYPEKAKAQQDELGAIRDFTNVSTSYVLPPLPPGVVSVGPRPAQPVLPALPALPAALQLPVIPAGAAGATQPATGPMRLTIPTMIPRQATVAIPPGLATPAPVLTPTGVVPGGPSVGQTPATRQWMPPQPQPRRQLAPGPPGAPPRAGGPRKVT